MKDNALLMNFWRFAAVLAIFENACRVGPGSVNDHPPMEIKACKPLYLSFKAVKRLYNVAELSSMGTTWKASGLKNANAKLTCVKPAKLRSSGSTLMRSERLGKKLRSLQGTYMLTCPGR